MITRRAGRIIREPGRPGGMAGGCIQPTHYEFPVILNEVKSSQQAGATSMLSLAIWPSQPWILRIAQDDKLGLNTRPSPDGSGPRGASSALTGLSAPA